MRKLLLILLFIFLVGCNATAPQDDPRITEDDLVANGQILNQITLMNLVYPISTPGYVSRPIVRVKGVWPGARVFVYGDPACSIIVKYVDSVSSVVDITLPNLGPGSYNFYFKQRNDLTSSNCSPYGIPYTYIENIAPPANVVLTSPSVSSSTDRNPQVSVQGVESSAIVSLFTDSVCSTSIASTTSSGNNVTFALSNLSPGQYNFYATQSKNGFISECSSVSANYEILGSLAAPSALTLQAPSSSPSSNSKPTILVDGVLATNTVSLYRDPNCVLKVGEGVASSTSIAIQVDNELADGFYQFFALQKDGSNNISSCSTEKVGYMVDSSTLDISSMQLLAPTSSPSSDQTPRVRVYGTENNASVSVYRDSGCTIGVGSGISTSVGYIDLTLSTLPIGTHQFYAVQIDNSSNSTGCVGPLLSYNVDISVFEPTGISFVQPLFSPNNDNTPTFKVTGVESGSIVSLHTNASCTSQIASGLSSSTDIDLTTNALTIGSTYTIYAKQVDSAGNISSCSSANVTYQVLAPTVAEPSLFKLVNPNTSPNNDKTPLFEIGNLIVGGQLFVYNNSACDNAPPNQSNLIFSNLSVGGVVENVQITTDLPEGVHRFYALQKDTNGSISNCSNEYIEYVVDVSAQDPTSLSLVSPSSGQGSDNTPLIKVEGVEIGATVYLYKDNLCTAKVGEGISTATDINITASLSTAGNYSFYAKQVDKFGNASSCSTAFVNYTLINGGSTPTSVVMVNPSEPIGNDTTPTVQVQGVSQDALVKVFSDENCTLQVAAGTSNGSTINLTVSTLSQGDGVYKFYANQSIQGSLSGCSTSFLEYTLDTFASAPSSLTLLFPASSPSSDDTPTIQVDGVESGAFVSLYTDSSCQSANLIGSITASSASVIITTNLLAQGSYTIYAKQTDSLGNHSSCSTASLSYEVSSGQSANDPLYADQWHLKNVGQMAGSISGEDINVESVWSENKGAGIHVRIVDDGVDIAHEDLSANVIPGASYNFLNSSTDPTPTSIGSSHGTSCAGVVGSRDGNSKGGLGVAPQAGIAGYNFLANATTANETLSMNRNIASVDVSSNSWGPTDGTGLLNEPPQSWVNAVEDGLTNGRGGKGTVYVFAAGNGASVDNSNYDGYANFYGVIPVCGVGPTGVFVNYSEAGSNLWVCAPTYDFSFPWGITTTDLTGTNGQNTYLNNLYNYTGDYTNSNYTKFFNGTSASAPIVSGVVALMLKANPSLSWRDVKIILAQTARQVDPNNQDSSSNNWVTNAANYKHNEDYGFGVVNAQAAVNAAKTWTNVGTQKTFQDSKSENITIPNSATPITSSISVSGTGISKIEYIEIRANINHADWGDLNITLKKSGSIVESHLSKTRNCNNGSVTVNCSVGSNTFRFGTARHLGESVDGTWTLEIADVDTLSNTGTLNSWSIKFYGE